MGCLLLVLTGVFSSARAELPEPDNILYGIVVRDGVPVTALDTDVVIEASRISDGVILASYRMGDSPRSGDRYTLRVPMEVLTPVLNPIASITGASLLLTAGDFNGVFASVPFTMGTRGQFQELNITQSQGPDSDGDGTPDEWELFWFGNLLQGTGTDRDEDGATDGEEYVAGTNPNDPNSQFLVPVARGLNQGVDVSFTALAAAGAGYNSKTRTYTLQATSDPGLASWQPVAGYSDVTGQGQQVNYAVPSPGGGGQFFRVVVQLADPGPPLPP